VNAEMFGLSEELLAIPTTQVSVERAFDALQLIRAYDCSDFTPKLMDLL
jgi:hypothetical protein